MEQQSLNEIPHFVRDDRMAEFFKSLRDDFSQTRTTNLSCCHPLHHAVPKENFTFGITFDFPYSLEMCFR